MHMVVNVEDARAMRDRLDAAIRDVSPALLEIANDYKTQLAPSIFNQRGPGWKPLSPRYARWKERNWPGRPIMVRTGFLRGSLTGGFGWFQTLEKRKIEFGSVIPYANVHHMGNPAGRLPRRRLVELTPDTRFEWGEYVRKHVVRAITGSDRVGF